MREILNIEIVNFIKLSPISIIPWGFHIGSSINQCSRLSRQGLNTFKVNI